MAFGHDLFIILPPTIASATFATLGYITTIRLTKGLFPSKLNVGKQLFLSLTACFGISAVILGNRRSSRDALSRMIQTAESSMALDFRDTDSHVVNAREYDDATGVDGERITIDMLRSL